MASNRNRTSRRLDPDSAALLRDIQQHLGDVHYFQREDLMQLYADREKPLELNAPFDSVATITRYGIIRANVTRLIETGHLVAGSRTDLMLPQQSREYETAPDPVETYSEIVLRLVNDGPRHVTVMAVVRRWTSDQHLSLNSKRVIVRGVLNEAARNGTLLRDGRAFQKK